MFDKLRSIFNKTITRVKKGVVEKTLSEDKFNEIMWDLELGLVQNNFSPEVIELFKKELHSMLAGSKVSIVGVDKIFKKALKNVIQRVMKVEDFYSIVSKSKKPCVIMFLGFNGAGKTTTLAKIASLLRNKGHSVIIAACDTFRAASIEQLSTHANALNLKVIKQNYGADSAAVAFDAIKHAESKGVDFVLIDTAGRSHENVNLMNELEKITRVVSPNFKVLVIDSLTGSDSVNQARTFDEKVGVDYIILTKADCDERGGAVISVCYALKKPLIFLGVGQEYNSLTVPNVSEIIDRII